MISWQSVGHRISEADQVGLQRELDEAWDSSGLIVAYHEGEMADVWDLPDDAEIAGVTWRAIRDRRGGGGGGGGGVVEFQQVYSQIVVSLWPYAKVAGTAALAGFAAKAGADSWDSCKKGLTAGLSALLGRLTHLVDVRVVLDDNSAHDIVFEIDESAAPTLETAIEAIAERVQGIEQGGPPTDVYLRWNSDEAKFDVVSYRSGGSPGSK